MKPGLLMVAVLAFGAGLQAEDVTGSSCVYDGTFAFNANLQIAQAPGMTCNLYPSTDTTGGVGTFQGNYVSISFNSVPGWMNSLESGVGITAGYLVVVNPGVTLTMDPNTGIYDDPNQSDWLQVLEFTPSSGPGATATSGQSATSVTLWTAGCSNASHGFDTSCFPSLSTIDGASAMYDGSYFFEVAGLPDPNYGPSVWNGSTWDATPGSAFTPSFTLNTTPEPSTFAIGMGGLALLAGLRRRRVR